MLTSNLFRLGCGAATVLALVAPATASPAATPEEVSGVLVPEAEPDPAPARSLLVVPRAMVGAAAVPVRTGLTYYERYQVKERLIDLFFDDTRTFGIYPRLSLESGLRPGVGVRLVHKDLLGARLRLAADYGGEHQQRLDGSIASPPIFSAPVRLHLRGGWQQQPRAAFFGIGDGPAVSAPFWQRTYRAEVGLVADPAGPFFGSLTGTYVSRRFGEGPNETPVDRSALVGWATGAQVFYGEAEVGIDTLRVSRVSISSAAPSSGTRLTLFGGGATGASGDPTRYARYGLDALHAFDLYGGDRVLLLRLHTEAVAPAAGDDSIPFTDLPRLGGPQFLRGYARDRFRDRVAVLGSVEYRYPIWRQLSGFLFVDAGKVSPGWADLSRAARPRLGYGGGLELYSSESFRMRTQLAGSEEGLYFQLAVDAVYRQSTPPYRI
jgi:hypothetical protein